MGERHELTIERVDHATDEVRVLVEELDRTLASEYAPEQRHGLDIDAIFRPPVRFFLARLDGAAAGCGGVALFATFAEVKRMYVRENARGRGVARALLGRIEAEALDAGHEIIRLETGDAQHDALRLYDRAGYRPCTAFGDYAAMDVRAIAASLFLEKRLRRD